MAGTIKERIAGIVAGAIGAGAPPVEVSIPEKSGFGHYATNVAMRLGAGAGVGKDVRKETPLARAQALAGKIAAAAPARFFEKVEAVAPGFINLWLSAKAQQEELARIARDKHYGRDDTGGGKTVIVEYSQPNIAKKMHVGHLRTTIIGDALANILEAVGYRVIRWNYLGDWGTQFGNLIAAYKLWGDKKAVEKDPIGELQKLYVRFHDEMKRDPELEKRGREEFKKLEDGDKENRALWEWFKKESLKEFERTYKTLGVRFDVWIGESFFEPEMRPLVEELMKEGEAERSEGSVVIRLDEFNLAPALIEKSDGASLYLTRDIANLRYRLKKYNPAKIWYVVANEQALHFEQLFAAAKKLGLDGAELRHVKYGLVLGEGGKKLSTREGRTVAAAEIIEKAVSLARAIAEKNGELSGAEKDEVAAAVAVGALKYNDLKENRMTDIVFDWDKMLDLAGDSAPYLQYTYARLDSILRKAGDGGGHGAEMESAAFLDGDHELALMRKMFAFPDVIRTAAEQCATSILATYLYQLAVAANKFYETTPVLKEENASRRRARLMLVLTAARTLRDGLALLGIRTPERI